MALDGSNSKPKYFPAFFKIWLLRLLWNLIQPSTAFSGMLLLSSIRRLTMACRTTPKPVQVGQAPAGLLNEKFAIPISGIAAPQRGQGYVPSGVSSDSACKVCQVRSEEHTSELQSPCKLVCRLLLDKNKKK